MVVLLRVIRAEARREDRAHGFRKMIAARATTSNSPLRTVSWGEGYFDEKSHHFSSFDLVLTESEDAGTTHPSGIRARSPSPFRSRTVEQISATRFSRDLFRRKPAWMRAKPSAVVDTRSSSGEVRSFFLRSVQTRGLTGSYLLKRRSLDV